MLAVGLAGVASRDESRRRNLLREAGEADLFCTRRGLGPSLGYHHTRPCLMITPKALDHALGELVRSVQTRQPPTRCAAR